MLVMGDRETEKKAVFFQPPLLNRIFFGKAEFVVLVAALTPHPLLTDPASLKMVSFRTVLEEVSNNV